MESLVVCQQQYNELYKEFHCSLQPCASRGTKPKQGTKFTRHCPNLAIINQLLDESLTSNDCICFACYKEQLTIVKSHEQADELRDKITIWETTISDSSVESLTKAVLHSVLYIAHELENERAVLLPDVSKVFCSQYLASGSSPVSEHTILENSEGTVKFSSKWLMKQLTVHLYTHIASKCVHKQFGTKNGGDLLTSLSWALGACKHEPPEEAFYLHTKGGKLDKSKILKEASDILNDIIHS